MFIRQASPFHIHLEAKELGWRETKFGFGRVEGDVVFWAHSQELSKIR